MAKGKKTGGGPLFTKDNKPKGGRPRLSPEIKELRILTQQELAILGTMQLECNLDELKAIRKNPRESVLRRWVAGILIDGMTKRQVATFSTIMDRISGPIKQSVELSGAVGGDATLSKLAMLTPAERAARMAAIRAKKENVEG